MLSKEGTPVGASRAVLMFKLSCLVDNRFSNMRVVVHCLWLIRLDELLICVHHIVQLPFHVLLDSMINLLDARGIFNHSSQHSMYSNSSIRRRDSPN